ncbi:polysaccharide pyruvyl transferase family protein [Clostridium sp. DL1XJH146]
MKQKITVGLLFHSFCCNNLGVGALALSQCEILKNITEKLGVELKVVCFESEINDLYSNATDVNVVLEKTSFTFNMIKKFRECDIIIDATGGDSFSDIYGMKNFIGIFIIKFYSLLSARTVILSPQTIGPYKHKVSRIIANTYLSFVKHIFIRDELSKKDIPKRLNKKLTISSDMAFKLPYKKRIQKEKIKAKTVGFNISGLLYSNGYDLQNTAEFSYKEMCDRIIENLLQKGYEVYLVSHVIGKNEDSFDNDFNVCEKICIANDKLKLAPIFNNPIEAKNFISGLDFFIGSRMHATIAAISSGVPTVPIAYSRKFRGVFEPLGYSDILDATKLSTQEIIDRLDCYVNKIEELGKNAKISAQIAAEKLEKYEEYITLLLENKFKN